MRNEIKAILKQLTLVREKVQGFLDNAENSDYPNDDRVERLSNEVDAIDGAIDALNDIE